MATRLYAFLAAARYHNTSAERTTAARWGRREFRQTRRGEVLCCCALLHSCLRWKTALFRLWSYAFTRSDRQSAGRGRGLRAVAGQSGGQWWW